MSSPRLTKRAAEAALAAVCSALAGEEGEGDNADVRFADLNRAREWLLARLKRAKGGAL